MLSTNFALMVRVQGKVNVEQVKIALSRVRGRHPVLIPAAEHDDQVFFPLSVYTDCSDLDWIETAQTQLGEPLPDYSGPFARFVLLQRAEGFDLVGVFHHGFSDGISGIFVLRDILQALGNPESELVSLPAPPPTGKLIPPALLSDPKLKRDITFTLAKLRVMVLFEKVRRWFSPQKQAEEPQDVSAGDLPPNYQFIILPERLTFAQTEALIARCKKEGVSVHAAVCVAWLRAFIAIQGRNPGIGTISSPVNLRERLATPVGDTSGMFLSLIETSVDCSSDKDFWEVARTFKQKLDADFRDEILLFNMFLFSKIFANISPDDLDITAKLLFAGPVKYDFSITNLGRVAIPEKNGPFQVEAFYGPLVNPSEYERTVGVSTAAGRMSMSFLFRKSMMEPAQGKELLARALEILNDAAG